MYIHMIKVISCWLKLASMLLLRLGVVRSIDTGFRAWHRHVGELVFAAGSWFPVAGDADLYLGNYFDIARVLGASIWPDD